jgi:hypothetical protein
VTGGGYIHVWGDLWNNAGGTCKGKTSYLQVLWTWANAGWSEEVSAAWTSTSTGVNWQNSAKADNYTGIGIMVCTQLSPTNFDCGAPETV